MYATLEILAKMAFIYPPTSYNDGGRALSNRLEQTNTAAARSRGAEGSTSLVFPENLSSAGAFNNHFMIINILSEAASTGRKGVSPVNNTEKSIILYMPNTLQFTTQNQYEETSLTSIVGKMVLGPLADTITTGAKIMGRPVNPQTEVLFSNVALRTFQFDFLFAPTSESETKIIKDIVKELRLAAAVRPWESAASLLWIPPRKLNLAFYSKINGAVQQNETLPKLKNCVIETVDFDFAPSGTYSTFSNGHPVSTRMQLRIKEDEVIERKDVEAGF